MSSWMRSQIANLHNAVSAPVTTTRDVHEEKLWSVRETVILFCNKMMDNIEYGRKG